MPAQDAALLYGRQTSAGFTEHMLRKSDVQPSHGVKTVFVAEQVIIAVNLDVRSGVQRFSITME